MPVIFAPALVALPFALLGLAYVILVVRANKADLPEVAKQLSKWFRRR